MPLSDKVMFGWPLVSDAATLSGGNWLSALPLANLQDERLAKPARSVDTALTDTIINIDHAASTAISIIALVRHNMRSAAQWRIRASASADMSSPLHDSGWVDVWPEQWPVGVLPSGHPNAATRLLTDAQIDALDPKRDAIYLVPTEVSARYWRIEISDELNADGFIQVGRLVMAPRFVPSYNFAVGAEFGFIDNTTSNKSESGATFFTERPKARALTMAFQNLPDAEAYAVLRDMIENLGTTGQLYLITNALDTESLQRRSFLGRLRQLSSVQYAAAGYSTVPLVVDEVL